MYHHVMQYSTCQGEERGELEVKCAHIGIAPAVLEGAALLGQEVGAKQALPP